MVLLFRAYNIIISNGCAEEVVNFQLGMNLKHAFQMYGVYPNSRTIIYALWGSISLDNNKIDVLLLHRFVSLVKIL